MTWNYRVIKSHWKLKRLKGVEYSIREVYYDSNGKPSSWTAEPQYLCAESVEELKGDLMLINQAFKYPVLHVVMDKDGRETLEA